MQALGRRAGRRRARAESRRGRWGAQDGRRAGAYWQADAGAGRRNGRAGRTGITRGVDARGARRAAWACLCTQAGRAGWSAGPSWCTVHLAQF